MKDEKLVRIAMAMIEGDFANSEDSKELMRLYREARTAYPKWGHTKAAILATVQFIDSVLGLPSFECPSCGGSHFGRDVKAVDGQPVVQDTVRCHDRCCRWHGVWPVPGTTAVELIAGMM